MSKALYAVVDELIGYSEKNLLKLIAEPVTNKGVTLTPLDDGGLHIEGRLETGVSSFMFRMPFDGSVLTAEQYTVSVRCDNPPGNNTAVRFWNENMQIAGKVDLYVNTSFRKATISNSDMVQVAEVVVRANGDVDYDHILYIQIEEGAEATEFEPYEIWQGKTRKGNKLYACVKKAALLTNLAPAINGTSGWGGGAASNVHTKYADNALLLTGNAGSSETTVQSGVNVALDAAHVYYARVEVYQENVVGGAGMYWPIAEPCLFSALPANVNEWTVCSVVIGRSEFSSGSYPIRLDFDNIGEAGQMWFDGLMLIDLTASFGAGNEPDAAWCDSNIPYFAGTYETDNEISPVFTQDVKKAYAVVSGLARLFYGMEPIVYTGEYSASKVTYEGKVCNLYTLKKAGTLTLKEDALYWMCGGGGSPNSTVGLHYGGQGGGGGYVKSGSLTAGEYTITIGAGASDGGKNGGTTKIVGTSTLSASGGKYTGAGGSGGGSGGNSSYATTAPKAGTGKGVSTYPFGLTSLRAHCAGGGGGIAFVEKKDGTYYYGPGGDGGTNGGSGGAYKAAVEGDKMTVNGGAGGSYGGGNGAGMSYHSSSGSFGMGAGRPASFYGGGSGGGGHWYDLTDDGIHGGSGSTGYQGVVYILIPA